MRRVDRFDVVYYTRGGIVWDGRSVAGRTDRTTARTNFMSGAGRVSHDGLVKLAKGCLMWGASGTSDDISQGVVRGTKGTLEMVIHT